MENLWGELPEAKNIKTPLSILKEQASKLEELTESLLTASINLSSDSVERIEATFVIVAPTLSNYSVAIFNIKYGIFIYPVKIQNFQGEAPITEISAKSEEEFKEMLSSILQSKKVKKIIQALLSQLKASGR